MCVELLTINHHHVTGPHCMMRSSPTWHTSTHRMRVKFIRQMATLFRLKYKGLHCNLLCVSWSSIKEHCNWNSKMNVMKIIYLHNVKVFQVVAVDWLTECCSTARQHNTHCRYSRQVIFSTDWLIDIRLLSTIDKTQLLYR